MMAFIRILFAACALAAGVACSQRSVPAADLRGVWAGSDCELLLTERYALLFERTDTLLTATLHRLTPDTLLLGRAVFSPTAVVERRIGAAEEPCRADFGELQPSGELLLRGGEGRVRRLERIERLRTVAPCEMLRAESGLPGSCMQQWTSGVRIACGEEAVRFEAGTNRHTYVFLLSPWMVYCRAARMRYDDCGGLFAQNIRMMSNAREHTAEMAGDNLAVSREPLVIDDGKFRSDRCVFAPEGIYWSFIRFEADTAVLHGCGEIYRFARPQPGELDEWFAFEKY